MHDRKFTPAKITGLKENEISEGLSLPSWDSASFISRKQKLHKEAAEGDRNATKKMKELNVQDHLADSMIEGTKNKMRTILRIGLHQGHDSLVLGALGCGAFRNPPSHIAQLFHEVIEEREFKNKYRLICFAILEDHNSNKVHNPHGNYQPFFKEFNSGQKEV